AASSKLAVLAAAPVVRAGTGLFFVARLLAGDAQAHPGHGLPPRFGYRLTALLAVFATWTRAQAAARALDRVIDGRVDLFLDGAVAGPTRCHAALHDQGL